MWRGDTAGADADAAADQLLTRGSAFRPTSLLPPPPVTGTTTMIVVAKAGLRGCNHHNINSKSGSSRSNSPSRKLARGPLIVRVFVPNAVLDEATVLDLKIEVERQVGVAVERQTLRADGVALLDDVPLAFLDPATVLFMDAVQGSDEDEPRAPHTPHSLRATTAHSSSPTTSSSAPRGREPLLQQQLDRLLRAPARRPGAATAGVRGDSTGTSVTSVTRAPSEATAEVEATRGARETAFVQSHAATDGSSKHRPYDAQSMSRLMHASGHSKSNNANEDDGDVDDGNDAHTGGHFTDATIYMDDDDDDDSAYIPLQQKQQQHHHQQQWRRRHPVSPPLDMVDSRSPSFGADWRSSVEARRPSVDHRRFLEDAMMRAHQQMELLAWLCHRSQNPANNNNGDDDDNNKSAGNKSNRSRGPPCANSEGMMSPQPRIPQTGMGRKVLSPDTPQVDASAVSAAVAPSVEATRVVSRQ
ncbi:hypothetical protein DQ04_09561000 [Trypanosoma grayi]|uniref:hypothetical protein n=1 Tax=Trypanosoma grayi TaxID=71804 RepID=UPI0004F4375A|nr:hypothetical protein DQ04_09561000 [Trypanosoma grayi]KEG07516.1 hypothetical protein DQ04_09561000 [Trypanosoma grayi]